MSAPHKTIKPVIAGACSSIIEHYMRRCCEPRPPFPKICGVQHAMFPQRGREREACAAGVRFPLASLFRAIKFLLLRSYADITQTHRRVESSATFPRQEWGGALQDMGALPFRGSLS